MVRQRGVLGNDAVPIFYLSPVPFQLRVAMLRKSDLMSRQSLFPLIWSSFLSSCSYLIFFHMSVKIYSWTRLQSDTDSNWQQQGERLAHGRAMTKHITCPGAHNSFSRHTNASQVDVFPIYYFSWCLASFELLKWEQGFITWLFWFQIVLVWLHLS